MVYCCDPVIGDHPGGLYVSDEDDRQVDLREHLLIPLADLLSVPNRFELEWLSGRPADYDVRNALSAAMQPSR